MPGEVWARYAFGALGPAYTVPVTLTHDAHPGGGTFSGAATVAATNGTAAFSGLSVDRPGNGYTLVASAPCLAGVMSAPFDSAAQPTGTPTPTSTPTATATSTATAPGNTPRVFVPLVRR